MGLGQIHTAQGLREKLGVGLTWVTPLQVGAGGARGEPPSPFSSSSTEAYGVGRGPLPTVERSVLIRKSRGRMLGRG